MIFNEILKLKICQKFFELNQEKVDKITEFFDGFWYLKEKTKINFNSIRKNGNQARNDSIRFEIKELLEFPKTYLLIFLKFYFRNVHIAT